MFVCLARSSLRLASFEPTGVCIRGLPSVGPYSASTSTAASAFSVPAGPFVAGLASGQRSRLSSIDRGPASASARDLSCYRLLLPWRGQVRGWVSIMVKPLIAAVIVAGILTGCSAGQQASANSATCHLGIVARDEMSAGQYDYDTGVQVNLSGVSASQCATEAHSLRVTLQDGPVNDPLQTATVYVVNSGLADSSAYCVGGIGGYPATVATGQQATMDGKTGDADGTAVQADADDLCADLGFTDSP
jgi:hypothetical protein